MADPTAAPALPSTADTTPYVPISWMAVAAALVAGLFVFLLLFFGYSAAFKDRKPLLMPTLLVLPVVGVVLSFAGRRMIRNSEGTRTGEKLTNAAWWTCVICGLGYAAYLTAIEYSIRRDAENEVQRWVGSILKGTQEDIDTAFIRTREPGRRGDLSPKDPVDLQAKFGEVRTAFGQLDIVRLAKRNPGEGTCKFVSGAVRDWMYRPGAIECLFTGSVKCPEGTFPVEVPLKGIDALPGSEEVGRQWVVFPGKNGLFVPDKITRTPYGWRVEELMVTGGAVGKEFLRVTMNGPSAMPFVYHTMIREGGPSLLLENILATTLARSAVGGGLTTLPPSTSDYSAYLHDQMLRLPDGGQPSPDQKSKFLAIWNKIGLFAPGRRLPGNEAVDAHDFFTVTDTAIEVRVPCELPSPGTSGELAASRGRVVVVCTEPDVIAELKRLRAEANPDAGSATPPPDFGQKRFRWRVARIESDLQDVKVNPQGAGGRGGPGGPGGPGGGMQGP